MLKRIFKYIVLPLLVIIVLLTSVVIIAVQQAKLTPPQVPQIKEQNLITYGDSLITYGPNWCTVQPGIYELYIQGKPFERGYARGQLTSNLIADQERYFVDQIREVVPSESFLNALKYLVRWFNRDIDKHIPREYLKEIYGVSRVAPDEYDFIGTKYERTLGYHAAHDIGHALQNLMLVGCTSFATWDGASEDSLLIVGRNFDFYFGDDFARDKIICFERPDQGHPFMMVTWGAMIGVVSGMNNQGLTVTINAASSEIPNHSATPISILAREILQYATTIAEADSIARLRNTFVSESILIGSDKDGKAAIIEKDTQSQDIYDPQKDHIICTNHYQSDSMGTLARNVNFMDESSTTYRYTRVQQLLKAQPMTPERAIKILRDRKGVDNKNIGLGNEKSINQLIAHHGIVFIPQQLKVFVSTNPYQLGAFLSYDLAQIFSDSFDIKASAGSIHGIAAEPDPMLGTAAFTNYQQFLVYKKIIEKGGALDFNLDEVGQLINTNPEFYYTYELAAAVYKEHGTPEKALEMYNIALTKEITSKADKQRIEEKMAALNK